MGVFLVWRIFFHENPRGQLIIFDLLRQDFFPALLHLAQTILVDLFEVTALAWAKSVYLPGLLDFSWLLVVAYVLLVVVAAVLAIFYLRRLATNGLDEGEKGSAKPFTGKKINWEALKGSWGVQAALLGVYALLVAGWPIWVTNLHIELLFSWDRFTLPMMLGVSLLFAGLVDVLLRSSRRGAVVIGILIGIGVGMHFHDAIRYRQDWLAQRDFFWQLSVRAPGIQPGTTLLTSALPFTYYSDNSLTAPLNWTYVPEGGSRQLPYILMDVEARLGIQFPGFEPGLAIHQPYRAASFEGDTSQALVLFYAPPRCLKIMDPANDLNLPYKPLYIPEALPLSDLTLILSDVQEPARPPARFFGDQPPRDWCYYFEKAELASQVEDWQGVVALGEKALKLDKEFTRETASELAPFIKGYAYTDDWQQAVQLSFKAYQASPKMQNMLCSTWYNLQLSTPASSQRQAAVDQIAEEIQCNFP
jgi:hypothetical protein